MLGAGVFVAFGPAAAAAGRGLPFALAAAAAIAWANADSSARLAARHPTAGGAYAYGRARLSPGAGVLAGTAFLVGKTASVAAIALTIGTYLLPDHRRVVAVLTVGALTALAACGVRYSVRVTGVVVALVLVTLGTVAAVAVVNGDDHGWTGLSGLAVGPAWSWLGVLEGAGLLFFAFAGYARIATLGEEVTEPRRTLPRAMAVALGTVLGTYAVVGVVLVGVLGTDRLAASDRPVVDVALTLGADALAPVAVAVAVAAAGASGLGVLLGSSRTMFAMARDGVLPRGLARLTGRPGTERPVAAQLAVGAAAALVAAFVPVAAAITASSAAVLVYYAVAHAAAFTLPGSRRRAVPAAGLMGCLLVAAALVI